MRSVDAMRSVIKKEIDNSDIYQFMTWLLKHDPDFKQKFIAFQTVKRMGVVK